MAAKIQQSKVGAADSHAASQNLPLDIKLLARAIKELNVSRTNASIYPPDHPQVARSIQRAHQILQKLNESLPSLTLGVAKDYLTLGTVRLEPKRVLFKEFATALHRRGIASITFLKGLSHAELHRFNQLMKVDPADIKDAGGLSGMMRKACLSHLLVQVVDSRYFQLTDEEEILREKSETVNEAPVDIWQEFINCLTTGRLATEGKGGLVETWENVDPIRLAQLINGKHLDPAAVVESYEVVITRHLCRECDPHTMEKLNVLLRNLNPELRRQFLSVTFDHLNERPEEFLDDFSQDIVLEMLQQANEEGRQISPTLISMVQGLSSIEGALSALSGDPLTGSGPDARLPLSPEQMQRLFAREGYEEYVDAEYSSTLEQLGADGEHRPADRSGPAADAPLGPGDQSAPDAGNEPATIEGFEDSIDEVELAARICHIMLSLMGQGVDAEDYQVFAQKIVEYTPDLLVTQDFDLLLRILVTFRRHLTEQPEPVAELAAKALAALTDPVFVSEIINVFVNCREQKMHEAAALMLALGENCVGGLMDLYMEEDFPASNAALVNLLRRFGRAGVEEACNRLSDGREHVVRNLLALIQKSEDSGAIPHIRPLLGHNSHWVRIDALHTLLVLRDPEAPALLRRALRSKVLQESQPAVMLAGNYRVGEVLEDLIKMLRSSVFRRSTFRRNELIIKALARIGDPKVVPALIRIARRNWPWFRPEQMHMKEVLFKSLSGYPRESISELLEIGKDSESFLIRNICSKALQDNRL